MNQNPQNGSATSGRFWKWLFSAVVVVVVTGVLAAFATDWLKDISDQTNDAPVDVSSTTSGNPWFAWVSEDELDVSPTSLTDDYGFPGVSKAVHTGRPVSDATGATAYTSKFSFDLTGKVNSPLRVTQIEAVIDSMTASPNATFAFFMPQGDNPKGQLAFDFRGRAPYDAVTVNEYGHPTDERYLDTRTVTVGDHESVGFQAIAVASENVDVRFHIEVRFDSGAVARVDNAGESFRVIGYPSAPKKVYVPAMLDSFSPLGLYECRWKDGCEASYNYILRDSFP